MDISVVIPVYGSEDCVDELARRLTAALDAIGGDWEVILVDDDSPDAVFERIEAIAARDPRFRGIQLMRNQGQAIATLCGLERARGDVIVTMDDDLQQPPEDIHKLVGPVREGQADCVMGRFHRKHHSGYRNLGSRLIRAFNRRTYRLPEDTYLSPFRAMSRDLVARMLEFRVARPAIAQLIFLSTRRVTNVEVSHGPRFAGESNYGMVRSLRLALDHFINASNLPLRFITVLGLVSCLLAFALGCWVLFRALFIGNAAPGWASVMVVQSFLFGILLLGIGVASEYIARILTETRTPRSFRVRRDTDAGSPRD